MKINYLTLQGSHVHKTGISLWWDVFFPIWTFHPVLQGRFCLQSTCVIFLKNCRKAFGGKRNKNGSQINELVEQYFIKNSKIFHKDKNGACCNENNMGSGVEVTFCSKAKGKKRVLDGVLLCQVTSQHTNHNDLYGIRFWSW